MRNASWKAISASSTERSGPPRKHENFRLDKPIKIVPKHENYKLDKLSGQVHPHLNYVRKPFTFVKLATRPLSQILWLRSSSSCNFHT